MKRQLPSHRVHLQWNSRREVAPNNEKKFPEMAFTRLDEGLFQSPDSAREQGNFLTSRIYIEIRGTFVYFYRP